MESDFYKQVQTTHSLYIGIFKNQKMNLINIIAEREYRTYSVFYKDQNQNPK